MGSEFDLILCDRSDLGQSLIFTNLPKVRNPALLPGNARPHADVEVLLVVVLNLFHLGQVDADAALHCGGAILQPSASSVRNDWYVV